MADPSPTLPATIRWPSETTRPAEHFAQVYRGEALRIACVLTEYAKPIDLTGASVSFFWQPIGANDPTAWWEAPNGAASASGNAVSIVFDAATMDDGHEAYRAFFRIVTQGGATYRANGVLGMLESPGANPNEIPFPVRTLDFATVQVLHAPYYTKAEADAAIAAAATLSARGLSAWTASPATVTKDGETVTVNLPEYGDYDTSTGTEHGWFWVNVDGVYIGIGSNDPNATTLTAEEYDDNYTTIVWTRTALPGYVLGTQTDKPLADADDTAAAIAAKYAKPSGGIPATDLASAVQTSLGRAATAFQSDANTEAFRAYGYGTDYGFYKNGATYALPAGEGAGASGTLALTSDIPAVSAETWTFEVDDGQGGTETVTKSVAVFAAAQGGA